MNITIKVEADELVQAILHLAESMKTNQPAESAEKPKAKRAKAEAPAPVEEAPAPVEEAKPVTLEVVRAKLSELSSEGKKEDIKNLFAKFGAAKLTELKPEHYGELLAAAEAL